MSTPAPTQGPLSPPSSGSQTPAPRRVGLLEYVKAGHAGMKKSLMAVAELMPAADYAFKPSQMSAARTYAGVIAHAADGMFDACSRAKGVSNPHPDLEKTLTDKAQVVKALAESIALVSALLAGAWEEAGSPDPGMEKSGSGSLAR